LFESPDGPTIPLRSYDVGPDGRFVMTRPVGNPEPPFTHMEVVLNFAEELRRRVPAQR
jgi:hypothetical protein